MRLDDFESVFRSAFKPTYQLRRPKLQNVVVLTDLVGAEADVIFRSAEVALADADVQSPPDVAIVRTDRGVPLDELLDQLRQRPLDLLITHRHVLSHWRDTPHAIGSAMSVLTAVLPVPVLMLPAPNRPPLSRPPAKALVATRHLTDDSALVDWALHLTSDDGTVVLAHVEDAAHVRRYLDAIGRIRGLNTDLATDKLPDKLLQLSRDYIASVLEQMRAHGVRETLHSEVRLGDPMAEFESIIEQHDVDLLVAAAREQQADTERTSRSRPINGRTFALATEFAALPVLFV